MNNTTLSRVREVRAGVLRRKGYCILAAIAVVVLIIPQFLHEQYLLDSLTLVMLWIILAGAWNLCGGYAGQFSLGHAAFYGIGAYTSTLLLTRFGVSPWLGMIAGGLFAAILSLLIGVTCFRLKGPFFSLATLAFGEVSRILAVNWKELTNGSIGIFIPFRPGVENMMFPSKEGYVYAGFVLVVLVLIVTFLIERSRLGYYIVAFRENEDAARALGINTFRIKLTALMASAFFMGIGGTFHAQYVLYIDPDSVFGMFTSIQVALIGIIGGVGTVFGPVLGAALMTILSQFLRAWIGGTFAGLHVVIYGFILIVVVLFMPQGMVTLGRHLRQRFAQRQE